MCWLLAGAPHAAAWQSDLARAMGRDVVVNAQGEVFAGGIGVGTLDDEDVVVEKLSPMGERLWLSRLSDTGGFLTLDPAGDVLVVGGHFDSDSSGAGVVEKLDATTGLTLWHYSHDVRETGEPYEAATDAAGNVFVVGEVGTGQTFESEGAVLKLDGATGDLLWDTYIYGTRRRDQLETVAVLPGGDVVVAGTVSNQIALRELVVARIASADGAVVWRKEEEGSFRDLAVDASGGILLAFGHGSFEVGDSKIVVRKLDQTDGSVVWQSTIGGLADNVNVFEGRIAVTSTGDVIVGGDLEEPVSDSDVVAVKLAGGDGQELWRTVIPGPSQASLDPFYDTVTDVTVDASDNAYLTGSLATADTSWDAFVHKLDASGDLLWSQTLTGAPPYARYGSDTTAEITVSPMGDPVVVGSWYHRTTQACCLDFLDDFDLTVVKLDGTAGTYVRPVAGTAVKLLTGSSARLKVKSADKKRIAIATRDTPAEPTVSGATLTLFNPTTLETSTYTLPASNWTVSGTKRRYRYKDDSQVHGPCRSATVAAGKLVFDCRGSGLGFSLDEASQGSLLVVMAVGAPAVRHCVLLAGAAVLSDVAGKFIARKAEATTQCAALLP